MPHTAELLKEKRDGAAAEPPRRILFVCTGNTCRSPMAAALLNHMARAREGCSVGTDTAGAALVATSAGLYAREGDPITPAAADALAEAGVPSTAQNDYRAHRARLVNAEMIAQADEVVAISANHAMELMLRFPEYAARIGTLPLDIPDPFGGDAKTYQGCLDMLSYAIGLKFMGGADADENG